jgi:acyl dehydratase
MHKTVTREQLDAMVGKPLGTSDWLVVDQQLISEFADVTEDHQYIHVDPERARKTPFGTTIAHGLLTLSLIVRLCLPLVPRLDTMTMVLNYGFDRVRFPAPLPCGSRIRTTVDLAAVEQRKPGQVLLRLHVVVEVEHGDAPALVADWLALQLTE